MAKPSTALATTGGGFDMAQMPTSETLATISDTLGGQPISVRDLPRLIMPSGKGSAFESDSGPIQEFTGVLVHWRRTRLFWKNGDSNGTPPDCHSDDGMIGVGNPGGACDRCFFTQFGTRLPNKMARNPAETTHAELKGANGPKACADKRTLFILCEGNLLPSVLTIPVMSVAPFTAMLMKFVNEGHRHDVAPITFSLKKEKSKSGVDYCSVVFELPLSDKKRIVPFAQDDYARVRDYADKMRPFLTSVKVDEAAAE